MSIASPIFLIYSDVATTRETLPMPLTSDAAPAVLERPKAVPPPREKVSTEIWNLPNSLTLLAVSDFFDGSFARRMQNIPRLGALLDHIADKLLMSAAFISLVELGLARAWIDRKSTRLNSSHGYISYAVFC